MLDIQLLLAHIVSRVNNVFIPIVYVVKLVFVPSGKDLKEEFIHLVRDLTL